MSSSRRFSIAVVIAAIPQISVAYVYASAPLPFILLLLLWNIAPFFAAAVIFAAGARYPAWGWLAGVSLFGLWTVVTVLGSDSSTAALGFMWTPVWSFSIVGPGAAIAVLAVKSRRDTLASKNDGDR